jgi:hypothetical protein
MLEISVSNSRRRSTLAVESVRSSMPLSSGVPRQPYFFFPGSVGSPFSFHVRIGQNTEVSYPAASAIFAACEDDRPVPQVKTRSVSFE